MGLTIALLYSLETCIVQIQSVWVHFVCKKRLFNLLAEAIINVRNVQCGSVCQVRNILFEDQTNSFFFSLGQGVYIFEESPKLVQDVFGDVYCPGKYCLNREKCESIGGYVATPRSIMFVESVEPGCFLTKFPSRYKST